MAYIPKEAKLQRDHVISMTNKGDKVGVYYMKGKKEHLVGEYHPKKADALIASHSAKSKALKGKAADIHKRVMKNI